MSYRYLASSWNTGPVRAGPRRQCSGQARVSEFPPRSIFRTVRALTRLYLKLYPQPRPAGFCRVMFENSDRRQQASNYQNSFFSLSHRACQSPDQRLLEAYLACVNYSICSRLMRYRWIDIALPILTKGDLQMRKIMTRG
jgi:hypothetical protein